MERGQLGCALSLAAEAVGALEHAGGAGAGHMDTDEAPGGNGRDLAAPGATGGHALGVVTFDDGGTGAMSFGFGQSPHAHSI